MQKKTAAALLLTLTLVFGIFFSPGTLAAVLPFETQYDYSAADPSWLTDLVIKENMDVEPTAPGLGNDVVLKAQPDYPYTQTADSFRTDVDRFCAANALDARTPRASYVFLAEFLQAGAGSVTAQVTDEIVRDYLEAAGIVYPAGTDSDDLLFARALYAALVSGAAGGILPGEADPSISLDQAIIRYLTFLSGLSEGELRRWVPDAKISSVNDYALAAARLLLWTNGYNVSPDTPEEELTRLTGVMTLKSMGVSVGNDATLDELKAKYIAALLGRRYDVIVDPQKLSEAMENGTAAFYMLQLLGKKSGLSIREDRYSYEDAFLAVASNTDAFALEDGEFYADIYRYTSSLRYLSSYVWIYPTAYATANEKADVAIEINGVSARNNYFNRVRLDPDAAEQTVKITVSVSVDGKRSLSVYYITLYEGTETYVPPQQSASEDGAEVQNSGTVMSKILSRFGVSASILDAVDNAVYSMLPTAVRGVISMIAPTFGETFFAEPEAATNADGGDSVGGSQAGQERQTSYFTGLLDKIGSVIDSAISGIRGAEMGGQTPVDNIMYNFITVE